MNLKILTISETFFECFIATLSKGWFFLNQSEVGVVRLFDSVQGSFANKIYRRCSDDYFTDELVFLNTNRHAPGMVRFNWEGVFVAENKYEPLLKDKRPPNSKCRFIDVHGEKLFVSDLGIDFLSIL